MQIATKDWGLERLWVVYPGHKEYPLDDSISVLPMDTLQTVFTALRNPGFPK